MQNQKYDGYQHPIVKAWLKIVKRKLKLMTLGPGESDFLDSPGALVELIQRFLDIFSNPPAIPPLRGDKGGEDYLLPINISPNNSFPSLSK